MNDREHVQELSASYALGALSSDEVQAVERHCALCDECASDLAEMKGIAATLPLACASAAPSAALKRQILNAARGDAAADQFLRGPMHRTQKVAAPWWTMAAAAAFAAGAAMGVGALVDHQRMAAQVAQTNAQLAQVVGREATVQRQSEASHRVLAAIAAGRVWDMSGGPPKHWWHCTIVQPPRPGMALVVATTPAAPKGMTYQAWVIHRGKVHNVGTVPPGKMSMMDMPMPVQSGDVVAFTVEPMGGSASPTMPYVMRQTLD